MDFLDPRKRRAHRNRLMIGYVLVALAVGLGTIILVYDAYGYGVNTKTGDIIQNGLLFVDSKPGGARIYLDGKYQDADTSSRLILPARTYQLSLKKEGYHDWVRNFTLSEHSISRYVYPLLLPSEPKPQLLKKYTTSPGLMTQTLDRRLLLVQAPRPQPGDFVFEEFDLGDPQKEPIVRTLSAGLLTNASQGGDSLTEVEWSTDNRHALLRHDYKGGFEFIIFDRQDPASSVNINRLFKLTPSQVALRNKRVDQVYIYGSAGGTLQVGNTGDGQLAQPFLRNVITFKSHGTTLLTYVTAETAPAGQVDARIWDNGQTYQLNQFPVGSSYLLDAAQFQGHWYYVAASNTTERIGVYKDPLSSLKDPANKRASPIVALRITGGEKVTFSANTRFIGVQAGSEFAVYDLEVKNSFSYSLDPVPTGTLRWMDGHRWVGLSGGSVTISDYDGINSHNLVPSTSVGGAFFDRDYEIFVSTAPPDSSGAVNLQVTDLRAGSDLPR